MRRPIVNPKLLFVVAVLVLGSVAVLLLRGGGDFVLWLANTARDAGATGALLFVLAYVVSTVALVPGSILTLAIGFAYGPVWGLALASPASVLGATAAFVLGRTLLRRWVENRIRASPHARAIDAAVDREGFKIVLLLRLSPLIPFDVLNYALSLSKIPLRSYVLASFLGMLPGTAMYVYLGSLATTAAEVSAGGSSAGRVQIALYVGGLVATVVGVVLATRAARRALRHEMERSAA